MPGSSCEDITSGLPMLALMGPKRAGAAGKAVARPICRDAGFPFGTSREIDLGYARVRASRLTYVGELGWELYMPAEFAGHVFDKLVEAGADLGLKMGGFFAINSLRMEKGYRHWGHDIGEEDTPLQAGLGFAVAFDKPGGFIGRDALLRQRDAGPIEPPHWCRSGVETEGIPPHLHHNEPILRDGAIVGSVTTGAYGHRVGASLGMGYVSCPGGVSADWLASGNGKSRSPGKRYPARPQLRPWYDPKGDRLRAEPEVKWTHRLRGAPESRSKQDRAIRGRQEGEECNNGIPPELERRITALEQPENQGDGFGTKDWIWLLVLGVIGPALLLIWGWQ